MSLLRLLLLFVALFCVVTPAAAQSEPPAIAVSAGAGIAFPFHSDFQFNPFSWHVSAHNRVANHVLIEGAFDQWRHTTTSMLSKVPLRQGSVIVGRIDEVTLDEGESMSVLGLNVLGTGAIGRVRITAGGGPGLMTFRTKHSAAFSGCTSSEPRLCGGFTTRHANYKFSVQMVSELDLALTSRVSAFSRVNVAAPVEDPGAGHAAVIGGIRVALR